MTQFRTITYRGFKAQVTGHVTDDHDVGLVYLEMAGAEAEVRAIWARLVSAEMKRCGYASTVSIDGSAGVRMERNTKYIALRTTLPDGQHVIGLLHPRATVTEPGSVFYIVEEVDHEGPPPAFFPRLAQVLPVPVKEEWAGWLWERGLEHGRGDKYSGLIRELASHGHVVGYIVKAHDVCAWLKVIRDELGFEGGGDTTWSPNVEGVSE